MRRGELEITVNNPAGVDVTVDPPTFAFTGSATACSPTASTARRCRPTAGVADADDHGDADVDADRASTFAEIVFHEANGLAPDVHIFVAVQGIRNAAVI